MLSRLIELCGDSDSACRKFASFALGGIGGRDMWNVLLNDWVVPTGLRLVKVFWI